MFAALGVDETRVLELNCFGVQKSIGHTFGRNPHERESAREQKRPSPNELARSAVTRGRRETTGDGGA